jgi:hypothetical protein
VEVVAAIFRRTSESGQVHSLPRGPAIRSGPFPVHGVSYREGTDPVTGMSGIRRKGTVRGVSWANPAAL